MGGRSGDDDRPSGLEATQIAAADATLLGPSAAPSLPAPGRAPSPGLAAGERLGRYEIERKVGAGGMGEVYAAHDPQLDRRVAIKVLPATYRTADSAARLVREAQALAKLTHPNVVAVHDAGEVDGRVFLAMQFVEGTTLGEHLARHALPAADIVALFVAAGRGLAAAHAAGLVHRDFKPGNVLIDAAGHVAVTDFGLARAADELAAAERLVPRVATAAHTPPPRSARSSLDSNVTQAGALIGTPAYMAPEQHHGERGSARSDQFAFCVALWEALFRTHPFVPPGHDAVTSPFEYTHLITAGALVTPAAGHAVPRRVIAALTRGLERAPERRWPSVAALLDELEPPVAPYRTAVVALAAAATVGAVAAGWLLLRGDARGPSCAADAGDRLATAWTAARGAAIAERFAATGRPYAATTAAETAAALDRYGARWSELAQDACAAGRGADAAARELAERRAACLDHRLIALRTVVEQLAGDGRGELVDGAAAVIAGLPALDDCADARALAAAGAPPPEVASKLPALEARLAEARVRLDAGLFRDALALLGPIATDADALGWAPLRVDVLQATGEAQLGLLAPSSPTLLAAAELATAQRLDRAAARAWTAAMHAAAIEHDRSAAATLARIAASTAAATGDAALIARTRVVHARALVRLHRAAEAEPMCRAVLAEAEARPGATARDVQLARDCLLEALVPLDRRADARAVVEASIAAREAATGPDHPAVADYLLARSSLLRAEGKDADALADARRAHAIRERIFGDHHLRFAESLSHLADFEEDPAARRALATRALAIAEDPAHAGARARTVAASIHLDLAFLAGAAEDRAATEHHFERALALNQELAGADSLEVAVILVNYGQHRTAWDFDGGVAMLQRSRTILERLGDPRAALARGALAMILGNAGRWAEALPVLEANLASADPARIAPMHLAQMRWSLARALDATKGDPVRARALAEQALAGFEQLGDRAVPLRDAVRGWLKKH